MGIPLRSGRRFTPKNNAAAPGVVVINEALAKDFFPGINPLGQRLQWGGDLPRSLEIVGIVGDAKYDDVRAPAPATFYIPERQSPDAGRARWFAVRTTEGSATVIPAIREVLRTIDPELIPESLSTQLDSIDSYVAEERLFAVITSLFGALAVVISMIGVFGLMSYTIARRTREIGIRMALGAARGNVLRSVLVETLMLVLLGVVIGVGGALGLTRFIATMLYGINP